jgi:phenylpyruvate tautomerase PptA (4-oxalocrotonate tautomerase family)
MHKGEVPVTEAMLAAGVMATATDTLGETHPAVLVAVHEITTWPLPV